MPFDNLENLDLYQILGVEKSDPSGEVHDAFVKKLPKHHPGRDPEGFQALQMAYRTLMDPKAREEYDNLMACGQDIASLMNNAFASTIQGRMKRAEQLIRRIVDETGGASEALMMLGMVQFEQGLFRNAMQTVTTLVDRFPRVALYRINLGNMLMLRLKSVEGDEAKEHVKKRAREQFEKAIELDDRNTLAYLEMAKFYLVEGEPLTAYEWVEKAVGHKGRVDFEDFEAHVYGFIVLAYQPDFDLLHSQAIKIEDCIPDDKDAKEFASHTLVTDSMGLVHDRKIEAARDLILLSIRLTPGEKELPELLKDLDIALDADIEWSEFIKDTGIIEPIKEMADQLFEHFMLQMSEDRLENAAHEFFSKLDKLLIEDVRLSLERMRGLYPAVWKLNQDFWQRMLNLSMGIFSAGPVAEGSSGVPWGRVVIGIIIAIILILKLIRYLTN